MAIFWLTALSFASALTDVCSINIRPDRKVAAFANGQQVDVYVGYETDEPGGIRIFVRPFTNGNLTPGYSASGSPLYYGSSTAIASFTINSGKVVVDEIQVEVYNSNQSTLLRRFWIPVHFRFGPVGINNFGFSASPELASLLLGEDFTCFFHYKVDYSGGVRIFIRPFTKGSMTPGWSGSPSPLYTGTGTNGSGSFRINSGKNVRVDSIRIQVTNADQSILIDEFFLPSNIYYSTVKITNIEPQGDQFPLNNEKRNVVFRYHTTESAGVRVFLLPWTNGAATPHYAVAPSGVYTGSGMETSFFTITQGNQRVDHLRFKVTNPTQSEDLLEFWYPVEYYCGNFLLGSMHMCPPSPARLEHVQRVNVRFSYSNRTSQNIRIFLTPMTKGAESPNYGVSGSPSYPAGTGTGEGFFRIVSGNVKIDQVRFQIVPVANPSAPPLAEFFIPVQYVYGNPTVSVDVPESPVEQIHIYPNPTAELTNVALLSKKNVEVRVYVADLSGRIVLDAGKRHVMANTLQVVPLDIRHLSPGIYLLVTEGDLFQSTEKLIITN